MPNLTIRKSDQIMMSLVHYFVTKENYAPIQVQGVKDEIWLENLDGPYRIIRITCNRVINEEQYKFEMFKMEHVLKQIRKKTLSFKVNALNICLDISKKVDKGDSKSDKYKYKLHYIYREFQIDFFRMDLNSLPKNASSLKFSKFDQNVMELCLSYKVNLGLSLRKTAHALHEIHDI